MNECDCAVFVLGTCQVLTPVLKVKQAAAEKKSTQFSARLLWMHKRKHKMPLKEAELNRVMHSAYFILLNKAFRLTHNHNQAVIQQTNMHYNTN